MLILAALLYSSTVSKAPVVPPHPIPQRATRPLTPVPSAQILHCSATMRLGAGENARTYTAAFTTSSKQGCQDVPAHLTGYLIKSEPVP